MTRLASKLPKGPGNGLEAISGDILAEPLKVRLIVAVVDAPNGAVNWEAGETEPIVRIRAIEVITGADKELAALLLRRAYESRNDQAALPFETEDDLKKILGDLPDRADLFDAAGVNVTTGVVPDDAPKPDEPEGPGWMGPGVEDELDEPAYTQADAQRDEIADHEADVVSMPKRGPGGRFLPRAETEDEPADE
jgi:hypothetical protein